LGVDAKLVPGNPGEYTIWVDSQEVAGKVGDVFPSDDAVVKAVQAALKQPQ
jgi:hypothetical protein